MNNAEEELQILFSPFQDIEPDPGVPILAYLFEGQEDPEISHHFPELESKRKITDRIIRKPVDMFSTQHVSRGDKVLIIGMIYIRYPWKRRKTIDVNSINFLREVSRQTVLAVKRLREEQFKKVVVLLPSRFSPRNVEGGIKQNRHLNLFIRTIIESMMCVNDSSDTQIGQPDPKLAEITFTFIGESKAMLENFLKNSLDEGMGVGNALAWTKKLIETPINLRTPITIIERFTGKKFDINSNELSWRKIQVSKRVTVKILYGLKALRSKGFELIAGVGSGSQNEPCIMLVHYKPTTNRQKKVRKLGISAKGVNFDSGGLDLKLTGFYDNMSYDMAGAATVLGTIRLAEERNLPVEIWAVIPIVENMIGSRSIIPGTVLRAHGGKTVIIKNTDCEGRLILAEAIAFIDEEFEVDAHITVGTLGHLADFGPDFLKVVATTPSIRKKAEKAGILAAEKFILFPTPEELNHVDDMHVGDRAELVNDVPGCYHTSPSVFMYNFFSKEPVNWLYLDISAVFEEIAPDFGAGPGFGLKFLWNFIQQFV